MRLLLWNNLSNQNKPKIFFDFKQTNSASTTLIKSDLFGIHNYKYLYKSDFNIKIATVKELADDLTLFNLFFRRLLSQFFGTAVFFIVQRQLPGRLKVIELAFIWKLASRVLLSAAPAFQSQRLREYYPWRYGAMAIYLSITCRDTTLLVNWLQGRLGTVSLFHHQSYFRSLGFFLGQAVIAPCYGYNLQGSCLTLAGKISVTGNSRKRSLLARYGHSGASCLKQRITQSVFLVRTRTGCLGGCIQIFY